MNFARLSGISAILIPFAAAACVGSTADEDPIASESDVTATSAELVAQGFAKKTWFQKTCPKGYPLPTGCDPWTSSVRISRYEHADGRVLFLMGDRVYGSFQRGSTLHTVLISDGRTYRHGRHALLMLRDVEWTKFDEPTLIIDIVLSRSDLSEELPATMAGAPLSSSGDLVRAERIRAKRSGGGYTTESGGGLTLTYDSSPERFAALRPHLVALDVGDTMIHDEILSSPAGDVPRYRQIPTPAPKDEWAAVAAPEIASGELKLPWFAGAYPSGCSGGTPFELQKAELIACAAGIDPGCSTGGERFAIDLSIAGTKAQVAYVAEAKPLRSTVALDGGRVFEGKTEDGAHVSLTLEPNGLPFQIKLDGRTYGVPDGMTDNYGVHACRARR